MKLSSKGQINVNYLDVNKKIRYGDQATTGYDKRDTYNFEMIKISYFSFNVHIPIFRNIFLKGINGTEMLSSNINDMIGAMLFSLG